MWYSKITKGLHYISEYPNIFKFWNKRMNIELNQIQNKSQFHTKILRLFNCWSSISLNSQYCIKFAIFLKIIGKLECRWDGQQRVWYSRSWWTQFSYMGDRHQSESVTMRTICMLIGLGNKYEIHDREKQIWGLIHHKKSYPPRLKVWIQDGGKSTCTVEQSQAALWTAKINSSTWGISWVELFAPTGL